jgi:hypothetical protein
MPIQNNIQTYSSVYLYLKFLDNKLEVIYQYYIIFCLCVFKMCFILPVILALKHLEEKQVG